MADEQTKGRFNPREHLRNLPGRGGPTEYLDVKWRLVWLRDEDPLATIQTELVQLDLEKSFCLFKSTVTRSNGAQAVGYGSETMSDFKDFIEKAETKSLGRALAALGYGTQFSDDYDMDNADGSPHVVDSPVERRGASPAAKPGPRPTPVPTRGNGAPYRPYPS